MRAAGGGVRPADDLRRRPGTLTRPLLLLWDIDGTLLQRASVEHAAALHEALEEVHGVDAREVRGVPAAGRTDGAIARDLLTACGLPSQAIDPAVERVAEATCRAYRRLCPADLSDRVADGVAETLDWVAAEGGAFRSALLTGNFEPVARLKLERAGIGHRFEPGQGAFGSDAEAREELPPIARERAGHWPRERTVIIGDTPNDIACARADGLLVVAVATGSFGAADLAGADHVVHGAAELEPVLSLLARG